MAEQNIQDEIKADNLTAEEYLLHYSDLLAEYQQAKEEYLSPKAFSTFSRGNLPGKPVEARAVKFADYDLASDEYYWLKAVEYAENITSMRKRLFIQARREAVEKCKGNAHGTGRPAWVTYCQRRFAEMTEDEFGQPEAWPGYTTMNTWWRDVINLVVRVHDKLEAIRADSRKIK